MKRVVCLYRVSTKGQVEKDDIPMQRIECQKFIDSREDWNLVREFAEKGISGYKVSAQNRDAIIEIRKMAERKEFDILLVFMFDRLGRREDETPFLVEWFINSGISVWSTREGEQRLDTRADKLMNFIRYWMAGGESEKTSMRVKAKQEQMTAEGVWRGGARPFGYDLVHKGRFGKKNRPLYDLEKNEVELRVVNELFDLITYEGWGTLRIANHLNEKYPERGRIWTAQMIRQTARNQLYTGRFHMNDVVSLPNEDLRAISDEQFAFAGYAIKSRIPRKYIEERRAENEAMPPEAKTKASIYGATLLSGILYCAHCEHKLVGGYCTKQRGNGAYHRPVYRCYNGAVKAKQCDGQSVYSAAKIEGAVLEIVHQYFSTFKTSVAAVWQEQMKRQLKKKKSSALNDAKCNLERLQKAQKKLRQELIKALDGESSFDSDILNEMLKEKKDEIALAEIRLAECEQEDIENTAKITQLNEQYQHIADWAEVFDTATNDQKKMILARIIEKITVNKDYHITIYFFLTLDEFLEASEGNLVEVQESEKCIETIAV